MFRIKICGITSSKDAQLVALAGADAIGINFFSESQRGVDLATAEKIAAAVPEKVARVGVFVNHPVAFVREIADRLHLTWIQLHGDELPEFVRELAGFSVLRAFRVGEGGLQSAVDYLTECQRRDALPQAVLLDSEKPGEFGGTGKKADWPSLGGAKSQLFGLPVVLAGGLTPFNVGEAIAIVKPDAVDVASGVESKPGSKDMLLLRAFVNGAKKAFA